MRTSFFRVVSGLWVMSIIAGCGPDPDEAAPASELDLTPPAIYTPRWAFEPWISKDISDGPDTYAFVQGFKDRDIPVGVVVLDSPWETNYNTFIPNPDRYPNFDQMIADMHAQDVRVVLWITQMVNHLSMDAETGGDFYPAPASNYQEASDRGYFVNDGDTYPWWKGSGGAIDFFNPEAMQWWHRQQDALLDTGINGWKLDFGESYVRTPKVITAQGEVSHQAYSEAYYRDFYAYGARRRGTDEFVTMARPYDESYDFEGRFFARREHAPVLWVGDQRRDWLGLEDALDHIFRSAQAGYVTLGSDIGGYLDRDDKNLLGPEIPFSREVFERWTAVGAMMPFMQLHGRTNLTPWAVPDCDGTCAEPIVEVYRYWSKLHHELVPFFYSLAKQAHETGEAILHPEGGPQDWKGDYRFMVGGAFLVAPLLDDSGVRDVLLPAGDRYYDWWHPGAPPIEGGTVLASYDASARGRVPLFVREGAIIPAAVSDDSTGLGTSASADSLTILYYPGPKPSQFVLADEDDQPTFIDATGTEMTLSRAMRPVILRMRAQVTPSSVAMNGQDVTRRTSRSELDANAAGWWMEEGSSYFWIKLPARADGEVRVVIAP